MRAFIEYPDISNERIEVKGDLYVISQGVHVEDIVEQWSKKNNE